MLHLLWLVPAIPFAGALVLAVFGPRMRPKAAAVVGVGTIAASALISILIAGSFLSAPPPDGAYTQTLWTWINVGSFHPEIGFYLDALSLVMMLVVTGLLNKQIAGELGTTELTIKVHRGRVMRKMGAGSLADLVRMAGRVTISS